MSLWFRRCKSQSCNASVGIGTLAQLLRAAQAGEHRYPQQIFALAGGIGRDLGKLPAEVVAVRFQIALVLDGLRLDRLQRHQATLAVVARDLVALAAPSLDEA